MAINSTKLIDYNKLIKKYTEEKIESEAYSKRIKDELEKYNKYIEIVKKDFGKLLKENNLKNLKENDFNKLEKKNYIINQYGIGDNKYHKVFFKLHERNIYKESIKKLNDEKIQFDKIILTLTKIINKCIFLKLKKEIEEKISNRNKVLKSVNLLLNTKFKNRKLDKLNSEIKDLNNEIKKINTNSINNKNLNGLLSSLNNIYQRKNIGKNI